MRSCARLKMSVIFAGSLLIILAGGDPAALGVASGAEKSGPVEINFTPQPVQFVFVDGDAGRFQAQHWMQEGYTGGIKNFEAKSPKIKDGITIETEGHALIDQHDYEARVTVEKEELWELFFYYQEFRKYFDDSGGTYYPFGSLALGQPNTGYKRELFLDLGKMEAEFTIRPKNFPEITFFYERHFKNGTKSRLTWATVAVGSTSRKIAPSFQEQNETVDTFEIKAKKEVGGFDVSAEQAFEFFGAETARHELSGTANLIRRQTQNPRSFMAASTVELERWFWKERAHFSSGYRVSHINNDEFESLTELTYNYSLKGGTHGRVNAIGENDLDTHTWVTSLLVSLKEWLSTTTRFKAEQFRHKGHSDYPYDTTVPPNGAPDSTQISDVKSKGGRVGESFSIRFTKIPRTALYNELEFEQALLNMREDRKSVAGEGAADTTNEFFGRDTLTKVYRGSWTMGAHVQPAPSVDITSQVRYRADSNNYDDRRETDSTGTLARSAFFDGQFRDVSEVMTRVSYKAFRLLQPSFRYQLQDIKYATRNEGMPIVKTSTVSHIYTFDVTSQPLDELLLTCSFSRQTAATKTPARLVATANLPAFNADVDSWLFSGSYSFSEHLVANSAIVYSFSDNFNDDFIATGLPLGVDDQRLDVTTGLVWTVNEHLTVEPKYAYYHSQSNTNADASGDYDAHLLSVEANVAWG